MISETSRIEAHRLKRNVPEAFMINGRIAFRSKPVDRVDRFVNDLNLVSWDISLEVPHELEK